MRPYVDKIPLAAGLDCSLARRVDIPGTSSFRKQMRDLRAVIDGVH
jgi:hypothetical protein